jgi:hypothetical protein
MKHVQHLQSFYPHWYCSHSTHTYIYVDDSIPIHTDVMIGVYKLTHPIHIRKHDTISTHPDAQFQLHMHKSIYSRTSIFMTPFDNIQIYEAALAHIMRSHSHPFENIQTTSLGCIHTSTCIPHWQPSRIGAKASVEASKAFRSQFVLDR